MNKLHIPGILEWTDHIPDNQPTRIHQFQGYFPGLVPYHALFHWAMIRKSTSHFLSPFIVELLSDYPWASSLHRQNYVQISFSASNEAGFVRNIFTMCWRYPQYCYCFLCRRLSLTLPGIFPGFLEALCRRCWSQLVHGPTTNHAAFMPQRTLPHKLCQYLVSKWIFFGGDNRKSVCVVFCHCVRHASVPQGKCRWPLLWFYLSTRGLAGKVSKPCGRLARVDFTPRS